jgi:hypothetical protein
LDTNFQKLKLKKEKKNRIFDQPPPLILYYHKYY